MAFQELCEIDEYDFRRIQEEVKSNVILGIVKNDLSPATLKYPKLFHELLLFARLHVAIPFTTIKVDNRPLLPTIDTKSVGDSYVVGLGEINMLIGHKQVNIRHKPVVFDRGACIHSIPGESYVITYYSQKKPTTIKIQDFEVVSREGKFMIVKRLDGCSAEYLSKKKKVARITKEEDRPNLDSVFKLMNEFKKLNKQDLQI